MMVRRGSPEAPGARVVWAAGCVVQEEVQEVCGTVADAHGWLAVAAAAVVAVDAAVVVAAAVAVVAAAVVAAAAGVAAVVAVGSDGTVALI